MCASDVELRGRFRRLVRTFGKTSHADASHATTTGYRLARFAGLTYRQRFITLKRSDARHVATKLNRTGLRIKNRSTARTARFAAFGLWIETDFIARSNAGEQQSQSLLNANAQIAKLTSSEARTTSKIPNGFFVLKVASLIFSRSTGLNTKRNHRTSFTLRPKQKQRLLGQSGLTKGDLRDERTPSRQNGGRSAWTVKAVFTGRQEEQTGSKGAALLL